MKKNKYTSKTYLNETAEKPIQLQYLQTQGFELSFCVLLQPASP